MLRRGGSGLHPKTGLYRQTSGVDVGTIQDGIGSAVSGTRFLAGESVLLGLHWTPSFKSGLDNESSKLLPGTVPHNFLTP